MAKMFYKLEEAAEVLGKTEDEVRELASNGDLQQFKDRNELMFKKEDVDRIAASGGSAGGSGAIPLSEANLGDSGSIGGISLMDDSGGDDTSIGGSLDEPDARESSGMSVFDTGEADAISPMDQTAITSHSMSEEDLSLEAVGSGSGLLDLTRESDDTSLGAELLDEIYPGGGSETGSEFSMESSVGSSGVFDNALSLGDTGSSIGSAAPLAPTMTATGTGIGGSLGGSSVYTTPTANNAPAHATIVRGTDYDPVGSGLSAGMLFGALIALAAGLLVVVAALMGYRSQLVSALIAEGGKNNTWMLTAALVVVVAIASVAGVAFARMNQR